MLLGKVVQAKDTLADQLLHRNVSAVVDLIDALLADTRKIQPVLIFAKKSYDGITASPQKKLSSSDLVNQLNTAETFSEDKVKTFGDVPPICFFHSTTRSPLKGRSPSTWVQKSQIRARGISRTAIPS